MKAFQRPQPGDLFYIPAWNAEGTHGFVIARQIEHVEPNIGYLIEVFDRFYTEPPARIEDVDSSRRLFRPIMWDTYFFKPYPRLKILFSDPNYDRSQSDYENIGFAFDSDRRAGEIWQGGESVKVPSEVFDSTEPPICWSIDNLISRVIAHLAGIFGPDEQYDYHRLPGSLRMDKPVAYERIEALAIEMDQKFQAWQAEEKKRRPRAKQP